MHSAISSQCMKHKMEVVWHNELWQHQVWLNLNTLETGKLRLRESVVKVISVIINQVHSERWWWQYLKSGLTRHIYRRCSLNYEYQTLDTFRNRKLSSMEDCGHAPTAFWTKNLTLTRILILTFTLIFNPLQDTVMVYTCKSLLTGWLIYRYVSADKDLHGTLCRFRDVSNVISSSNMVEIHCK